MKLGFRVAASLSFCFALTVLETSNAHAFCRTNSCDPARGEVCPPTVGCKTGGVDLYWANSCVTFAVQKDGSKRNEIDASTFEQVINSAFDTWMNVDCGEGLRPSITVGSHGAVACDKVEYNKGGNANIYMFRDDEWLASGPGNALALTTVWYDWHTGKIYDADVEVNGTVGSTDPDSGAYDQRITNGAPEDGADLLSIITHESGHFLGLDHAIGHPEATMYTFYEPGVGNLRKLSADDQAGICAVYPPDRTTESDNCDPRHGFSSKCYVAPSEGCSLRAGDGARTPWLLFAAGVAALLGVRRARRRSAH